LTNRNAYVILHQLYVRGLVCLSMLLHCLACALTAIHMPSNRLVSEQSPRPTILGVTCARNGFISDQGRAESLALNGINNPLSLRSCPLNFLDSSLRRCYPLKIIISGARFSLQSLLFATNMRTYSCHPRSYLYPVSEMKEHPIRLGGINSWSWSITNPGWFGCFRQLLQPTWLLGPS